MRQRIRRHPAVLSRSDLGVAILAAALVLLLGYYLLSPFEEPSLAEYRSMGQVRAYWEFGKSLLPVAVAALVFVGVLLFKQSQSPTTPRGGHRTPASNG